MIEDKIYEILKEVIHYDHVEIIYTKHYLQGTIQGYDEKNHLLMIRDTRYGCNACKKFELDVKEIKDALEKHLPITLIYDTIITIQNRKTYRFYLEINEEE